MKALCENFGRSVFSLLVIGLAVFFVLASYRGVDATTLYIIPDTGTPIPGSGYVTNLPSFNTSRLGGNNDSYKTFLSTSAPTDSNTRMRERYSTSGTWYHLGYAFFNPGQTSNATISADATGKFYLVSSKTNDDFRFKLLGYDSTTGVTTDFSAFIYKYNINSTNTNTPRPFDVEFANAEQTLNPGQYLMVEIWYRPSSDTEDGYVYCNDNNTASDGTRPQSRIDVGIKFNITSSAGINGSISGPATTPGTATVDWDSNATYTITANSGYAIQTLLVDGVNVPAATGQTSYSYTFSNVKGNHTINAVFNVSLSTFNISPGTGGCVSLTSLPPCFWPGGSTYSYTAVSGTYTFVVTPDSGFGVEWVRVDGVDQGVPLGQTTPFNLDIDIGAHNTLAASFQPFYTVTSSAATGGTIMPSGTTAVLKGQALTLDITPDIGYRLLAITDNGVNVGNTSPYSITDISQDHTVVATFQKTYTITATAGPNGTISPIGAVSVDSGSSRNFSITGDLGFRVSDVLIDGVSIGAVTAYTFLNVSADHTISVVFEAAPLPSTYCSIPPFIASAAPPSVMLMLSVESPMEGAANPTVTCTGKPSSTSYACSSSGLGAYDNSREYYGYFESGKCYTYSGSGATGLFTPSGAATNHQCPAGTAWSGNMLNWSTTLAVDAFRKAFTGGNRTVDVAGGTTVLLAAVNDGSWFPAKPTIGNAELYMPVSGTNETRTIVREGAGIGFGVCNEGYTSCSVGRTGSGEAQWPTVGSNTNAVYSLRVKACDSTGGAESRCNTTTNKPEGTIQKYMEKMRFALMSYAADNSQERDGGVLRSVMKWVNPTIAEGMFYHDASGTIVSCNTAGGCVNPEREVETTGVLRNDPAGSSVSNSGIINYINKFAYTSGYKGYDPMGEMYYEVVRYFKNLTPSVDKYCSGLTSFTAGYSDGFAFYCNASKTNTWGWRRPDLYSCSQNFVIAVNDANPWLDKRIPGSAFKADYGGSAGSGRDWCGSAQGACDTDFLDGGTQVDVEGWTNKVGDIEGLTGKTLRVACEVDAAGACLGGFSTGKNVVISKLGRIIGTPPGPGKENSYNVAGLAYYAHMTDLRPDLAGVNNLTTYMIDTQEPGGSMLVGPFNMLYLAAKYGGFEDKDHDQSIILGGNRYNAPYQNATSCGGIVSTPNALCSEWDADNDGNPDNYFFASDSAQVENALNSAFSSILTNASSGTAAAVANNKSGERGANIIQALFYPQWPNDKNIKWLGEVQALWYYLDPVINYSTIREDTDGDLELDLTKDQLPPSDPYATLAIWKGGLSLHKRAASDRKIYALLDSSKADLTDPDNAFTTTNRVALKPLLNISSFLDTEADAMINYLRGVDGGTYRSRTVTSGVTTGCWKLGDVINSTPQVQSSVPTNSFQKVYSDSSYNTFILSDSYKNNNMVYAGANDGMMHAFRLGIVTSLHDPTKPFRIASIKDNDDNADLGKEDWAFVPANALPYLKNQADQNYCHQYLVDGAPVLFDASINMPDDCTETNYWDCLKKTTLKGGLGDDANEFDPLKTSWKSVLIGSMGLGGASRNGNCNETLNHDADMTNNTDCVKTPITDSGFSSYFALDVSEPLTPKLMWEFSDANIALTADKGIGLTTPGVSIVRINAQTGSPALPNRTRNGRWFAVFASGPTGTIDTATRQFLGRSDQNLKIYVVDIGSLTPSSAFTKNVNYWVFDTTIKYAFSNSVSGAAIDLDRSSSALPGNYSDDVVYITYTKASLDGDDYPVDWDKGGVIRLVTNNDPDPSNWFLAPLIDDIGPVTTSIGKLQDRIKKKLWIYFGEGRYFYKGDELTDARRIFGVADPCYNFDVAHTNTLSTTLANCPALSVDASGVPLTLKDQTSTPNAPLTTEQGWYITLDSASGTAGAERVVSDVTAATNGIVFYTTYSPDSDICTNGGLTSLWAVLYSSGGTPPSGGLKGKAPLQTSSGGISMIDLASSFTQKGGRKLSGSLSPSGMAPKGRFPPLLQPKAVKKVLNIQER